MIKSISFIDWEHCDICGCIGAYELSSGEYLCGACLSSGIGNNYDNFMDDGYEEEVK